MHLAIMADHHHVCLGSWQIVVCFYYANTIWIMFCSVLCPPI